MKKKLSFIITTLILAQTLLAGAAFADYKPAGNINLGLTLLPSIIKPSGNLSNFMFNTQESAHNTITDLTGLSIDHSYVNVGLNGINILAIDPPVALINKRR